MGVDEIQRVNSMAKEFMMHGIVGSSDDAVMKAESMMRGNGVNSIIKAAIEQSASTQEGEYKKDVLSDLSLDVRSLGVRFNAMANEFLEMKNLVSQLNSGLGDVDGRVNRLAADNAAKMEETQATLQAEVPETVQQTVISEVKAAEVEAQKEEVSDDSFKTSDVAIEKIFYFGK
jgi:hypothetical protein